MERCTNRCAIATKGCALRLKVKSSPQNRGCEGSKELRSSLPGDPDSKFLSEKLKKDRKKRKGAYKKGKKKKIRTAELNRRDQVTAPNSWPGFHRKTGAKVDYQVAAPTETSTPTMHRATIAQQRVRMEGWRQERLGSRAGTHSEEEKNKNILTGRKREKTEKHT